jgi:hypothetical protein
LYFIMHVEIVRNSNLVCFIKTPEKGKNIFFSLVLDGNPN